MTAAERLKQLSGMAGVSAAVMLLAIGQGATAGDVLVNHSGLASGTAAEHILVDRIKTAEEGGGGGKSTKRKRGSGAFLSYDGIVIVDGKREIRKQHVVFAKPPQEGVQVVAKAQTPVTATDAAIDTAIKPHPTAIAGHLQAVQAPTTAIPAVHTAIDAAITAIDTAIDTAMRGDEAIAEAPDIDRTPEVMALLAAYMEFFD